MPSKNSILLMAGIILTLLMSMFQGHRIEGIQDTELFYRWALSAASLTRLDETLEPDKSESVPEAMDQEVFERLVELGERELPDYEVDPVDDVDDDGNSLPRLVRAARQNHDDDIWKLVTSSDAAEIRADFLKFLNAKQIQSLGTQFAAGSLYDESTQAQGVGIAGLFFGFRKVAANFLWIQVENFWHQGQMHRMVPIMRTCVTLDPSFIDAYLLGSWHLAYNIPAKIEPTPEPLKKKVPYYHKRIGLREEWYLLAAEFLRDGIRKNPRDYRLYFDLGYAVYAQKLEDHPNAILYLDEARRHKHNRWVPRMLFRSLTYNGQYEDAIDGWQDYIQTFGESDVTYRKIQENLGFLSEATADEARECKNMGLELIDQWQAQLDSEPVGSNTAELQAKIDNANEEIERLDRIIETEILKGLEIWTNMYNETEAPLALAQLTLRRAKELAANGQHLEAIAELDFIRWHSLAIFDEASDMIIEFKQEAGLPLTVSEQRAVIRMEDLAALGEDMQEEKKIQRVECSFEQHAAPAEEQAV